MNNEDESVETPDNESKDYSAINAFVDGLSEDELAHLREYLSTKSYNIEEPTMDDYNEKLKGAN